MWWTAYFCFGLFFGGVLFYAIRFGFERDRLRPGIPTVAVMILVASLALVPLGGRDEVAAYPLGLVAVGLTGTLDLSLAGASTLRKAIAILHAVVAIGSIVIPLALFAPHAIRHLEASAGEQMLGFCHVVCRDPGRNRGVK